MGTENQSESNESPLDLDRDVGERVEKKPKEPQSPQQEHEDEDQG